MLDRNIKIAILSGKGGTGKTLLAVNLATVSGNCDYLDCDVEEPNGFLFFKPKNVSEEVVTVKIPNVDQGLCDGCRICVNDCRYNALFYINHKLKILPEMCHSCGVCSYVCPQNAISEQDKAIGKIVKGEKGDINVITGMLNVKEHTGIPIIKKMFVNNKASDRLSFIDCAPGSSCMAMECIKEADYCIIVSEPTLFGAANLEMVYELVQIFEKPCGVIINKNTDCENDTEKYCANNKINIISRIAFDHDLGKLNSKGLIVAEINDKYHQMFDKILKDILREIDDETITCS